MIRLFIDLFLIYYYYFFFSFLTIVCVSHLLTPTTVWRVCVKVGLRLDGVLM